MNVLRPRGSGVGILIAVVWALVAGCVKAAAQTPAPPPVPVPQITSNDELAKVPEADRAYEFGRVMRNKHNELLEELATTRAYAKRLEVELDRARAALGLQTQKINELHQALHSQTPPKKKEEDP